MTADKSNLMYWRWSGAVMSPDGPKSKFKRGDAPPAAENGGNR